MASFAPVRGTRSQIEATSIVDGQFLLETDQGSKNKIYLDNGSTRVTFGGGSGGATELTELDDVVAVGLSNGDILKYNSSTSKFVTGNYLDGWLKNSGGSIQEPYISAGYKTASFSNLNSSYAYEPYIDVPSGVSPPTLEDFVITGTSATVTVSEVTAEQAGTGTQCRVRLRELK